MSSMNLWYGVNALREVASGRATAEDVIRVAAMIADLDVERITAALDAAGIPQEPVTTTSSKKPRGERGPKAERPPLYAVTAAMTPGKPSPKVRTRLATALTDVAIETDRHHKTRDHTLVLLRLGYNGESGVGEALQAL
jgi:hypothetical protein